MMAHILSKTTLIILPKISLILFIGIYTGMLLLVFSKRRAQQYNQIANSILDQTKSISGESHEHK